MKETTASQILHTELHRPLLTADLVPRSQLLAELEGRRRRLLTLVSTPAGYGKSALLSNWLAEGEFPSAWVSLDANDNDLRLFLDYFLSAVQSSFPKIKTDTRAFLGSTRPGVQARLSWCGKFACVAKGFSLVSRFYGPMEATR